MMTRAILVLSLASACMDGESGREDPRPIVPDKPGSTDVDMQSDVLRAANRCNVIETDGPCALACTPDALLEEFVPEGTCIIYDCTLEDGSPLRVGGCNL
jgi:hypothetical protein